MEYCTFAVRLKPGSKTEKVAVDDDGKLNVAVHDAPIEGKANCGLIALLAKKIGIPKTSVTLIKGQKSRDKVIRFDGCTREIVLNRLSINK